MNIHDMAVKACNTLQAIPRYLAGVKHRSMLSDLAEVVYVQQARIESLERAVIYLARISSTPTAVGDVNEILKLQEPNCGSEPDEPDDEDTITFSELVLMRTLIWAEGPLVSLVKHEDGNLYVLMWVDVETASAPGAADVSINYYTVTQVTQAQIDAYLRREVSLCDLQKASPKMYYGSVVDDDDELDVFPYELIPEAHRAPTTSFYDPSLAPPTN